MSVNAAITLDCPAGPHAVGALVVCSLNSDAELTFTGGAFTVTGSNMQIMGIQPPVLDAFGEAFTSEFNSDNGAFIMANSDPVTKTEVATIQGKVLNEQSASMSVTGLILDLAEVIGGVPQPPVEVVNEPGPIVGQVNSVGFALGATCAAATECTSGNCLNTKCVDATYGCTTLDDCTYPEFQWESCDTTTAWKCVQAACAAQQTACGTACCDDATETCDINTNACIPKACTESWTCTAWSACTAGKQTKSCTDANDCGTTTSKPAVEKTCGQGGDSEFIDKMQEFEDANPDLVNDAYAEDNPHKGWTLKFVSALAAWFKTIFGG
ncbi:MAG TPA: hypothetical protein DHN29_09635 [Cytophagales bacterium]|nr:hypothetical protein [Cytophagales bacterium]